MRAKKAGTRGSQDAFCLPTRVHSSFKNEIAGEADGIWPHAHSYRPLGETHHPN